LIQVLRISLRYTRATWLISICHIRGRNSVQQLIGPLRYLVKDHKAAEDKTTIANDRSVATMQRSCRVTARTL
jgi:hypothetical protein